MDDNGAARGNERDARSLCESEAVECASQPNSRSVHVLARS